MRTIARHNLRSLIVFAVIFGYVSIRLYGFIHTPPAPQSVVESDIASYATALIQGSNPQLFPRDTVFAKSVFTNSIWYGSSSLYMTMLKLLHELTQHDIWLTYGYFILVTLTLFLIVMYFFYTSVLPDWRLALAITIISSFPSGFAATDVYWGVIEGVFDGLYLIPQTLYSAFLGLIGWLIVQRWPETLSHKINPYHIVVLGLLVGASIYLIHSVSGVALLEILFVFGLIQIARRKLPWWAVMLFVASAAPFLLVRLLVGSGVPERLSQAGSRVVVGIGQNAMIFPWHGRWSETVLFSSLTLQEMSSFLTLFFICYVFLTVIAGVLVHKDKPRARIWKSLFITVQAALCLIIMRAG